MKKILIAMSILLIGCSKEELCDCTYYSADKTNNGSWTITYESDWDSTCGGEDFGTSKYYSGGNTYYTHTYVKCK